MKKILVTGDLIREFHVYQGSRTFASIASKLGTRIKDEMGGAQLLQNIIEKARPGISTFGLQPDPNKKWPEHLEAHAVYTAHAAGFKDDPKPAPGVKPKTVWRVSEALGYGLDSTIPPVEPALKSLTIGKDRPKVLLIDDGGAGFRNLRARGRWPDGGDPRLRLPDWVVLKMSQPSCEGDMWRHLAAKCNGKRGASRLVVIVPADELRRDGAAINRGLSWERTVSDTWQTLTQHPRLSGLRQADHLIIVFRREGALWIRRDEPSHATLIFDPRLAEGQWTATLNDDQGKVFGHLSVFTAAIAIELAEGRAPDEFNSNFVDAVRRGLTATRELCLRGHGDPEGKSAPTFPFKAISTILKGKAPARPKYQPSDEFINKDIQIETLKLNWTIASENDPQGDEPTPLYGLGFQTAIYGPERLSGIPQARFGELLTVDRAEIETLRGLRQMIQAYENGGRQKQPLCIGAFGPPGSGKSFGIKQIAFEVLGKEVPFLEFNLAQFSNSADLVGAFHQVRDKVLSGRTPVVFWDEFDSEKLRWLQFLLAPMQDGKFQSGQLTHTLGKCIFVFAGGTSWDFEHFGPAPKPVNQAEAKELKEFLKKNSAARKTRPEAEAEFRLKKGPDFLSRLNGHINVLGPNRRLLFDYKTGEWNRPDSSDITFPVRRALLLRNILKVKETKHLELMDRDLLNALIRQPRYSHGVRSMEKVVEPLAVTHAPLRPAQLPPPQVLAQHLDDCESFQALLSENTAFLTPKNLHELAAAIHENYRRLTAPGYIYDPQFRKKYDKLDAWGRATNLAAASGIPHVLSMAGLCVKPGRATTIESAAAKKRLINYLEPLRREEHFRWMSYLTANGWLQSPAKPPIRDKPRLLHTCLIPFDELDENDQKKDDQSILSLPETVALVGFKIALVEDLTFKP